MSSPVTIGIPCFNSERWIALAVESALAQDWPEKEVIVVDDGSTDKSREILRGFGSAIRLVLAEHRGSNSARNEILNQAGGDWIQYLDADDFLLPLKISRQFSELGDRVCGVVYSPVWIEESNKRSASELDPGLDIYAQWLAWQLPQTGGCLWRTEELKRVGGWNEKMPCCQEHELYLRALKAGVVFSFTPTPNAVYRIWSEETLCRRDPRQVIRIKTDLIKDLREWMSQRHLWMAHHQALAGQVFFEMSRTLAKYDIAAAASYHAAQKGEGLITLAGPAAPLSYKLSYWTLGFTGAEKLARALR